MSAPASSRARASRRRAAAPARGPAWTLHGAPAPSARTARLCGWAALLLVAAFGIALYVVADRHHPIGDYFTETDFYGAYADGARAIQRGVIDPTRYGVIGPVYEVALALAGWVVPDLFLAAELLSIVSMMAALWLWFHLLARRSDARIALAALPFIALNPHVFRYGFSATTDALAFALQALALDLVLARSAPRAAIVAGVVSGLAFLTRYSAAYLLPAGLIAIVLGGTIFADRRRAALGFAAGFLALVLPWIGFSLAQGSHFSFQLHHNIAYDVFARSRGMAWDEYQEKLQPEFTSLWDVVRRDPMAVARRELFNVWDHLRRDVTQLVGIPTAVCALAGLALGVAAGSWRRQWPLLLAGAGLFVILIPAFYSERYSLPLMPLYAALAGMAFASPAFALALRPGGAPGAWQAWLKPALIVLPFLWSVPAGVRSLARVIDQLPRELLQTGTVLRGLKAPGDRIIARKPHIAYHGDIEVMPFPFAKNFAELADAARRDRVRWLLMSWPEVETRPAFWHLLDTTGHVPGLTVRFATPKRPVVLYEIGPGFGDDPPWYGNDTLVAWHAARAHLRVNGTDPRSWFTLAFIERTRGNDASALANVERALRLDPRHLEALLLLGDLRLGQNDAAAAMAAYRRAQAVAPDRAEPRVGIGWAALALGRTPEAVEAWRPIVGVVRDPATLRRMVDVFRATGDAEAEGVARTRLTQMGASR